MFRIVVMFTFMKWNVLENKVIMGEIHLQRDVKYNALTTQLMYRSYTSKTSK